MEKAGFRPPAVPRRREHPFYQLSSLLSTLSPAPEQAGLESHFAAGQEDGIGPGRRDRARKTESGPGQNTVSWRLADTIPDKSDESEEYRAKVTKVKNYAKVTIP